jgi:membrane protease YdiL (CAAX protease family)
VLVVREGEPTVLLDGAPVAPGEHTLEPGARLQVGPFAARYEAPSRALLYGMNALAYLAVAGFVVLVVRRRGGTIADLGLKLEGAAIEAVRGVAGYLAGTPLVLGAMLLSRALCRVTGVPFESHPLLKSLATDHGAATIASLFLLAGLVAPACEEVIYRGFLLRAMRRAYPSRLAAAAVTSFFFGSLHPGLSSVLPITAVGAVFSAVFLTSRRGSLVGAIVAHVSFNAVNILFELALLRAGA